MNNGPRPYLQIAAARTAVTSWVDSPPVQRVIIALVVVNAITLGLETVPAVMAHMGAALQLLDRLLLTLWVCELLLKLAGHGLRFFRSGWNIFDLTVVGMALIPASGPLAVFRALRVLRIPRLVSEQLEVLRRYSTRPGKLVLSFVLKSSGSNDRGGRISRLAGMSLDFA